MALDMNLGGQIAIQLINILFLIILLGGFVLFVKVMFKLNKALDIWLEQNKKKQD